MSHLYVCAKAVNSDTLTQTNSTKGSFYYDFSIYGIIRMLKMVGKNKIRN